MKIFRHFLFLATLVITPCLSAAPSVEVGFSPEGSAQQLILKTIDDAKHSIRVMAYSFTSPEIVKALIKARKRGVDIQVVVDAKSNQEKPHRSALNLLAGANIPVRVVSDYRILHDKVMIVDEKTVQTGSFNFTRSASRANSENVVVLREMKNVAEQYLAHWQSRWEKGVDWKRRY